MQYRKHNWIVPALFFVAILAAPRLYAESYRLLDSTRHGTLRISSRAVAAADERHIMSIYNIGLEYGEEIRRSTDGGQSWRTVFLDTAYRVQISADSEYVHRARRHYDIAHPDPDHAFVVGDSGLVRLTRNGGQTWEDSYTVGTLWEPVITMHDSLHGLIGTSIPDIGPAILSTRDGWRTYTVHAVDTIIANSEYADLHFSVRDVVCLSPTLYIALCTRVGGALTLRSEDGGASWQFHDTPADCKGMCFADARKGWIAGRVRVAEQSPWYADIIYHTADGGKTWQEQLNQTNHPAFFGLRNIAFSDARNGVAVGDDRKVLFTTNGGQSWHTSGPLAPVPGYSIFFGISCPQPGRAIIPANTGYTIEFTFAPATGIAAEPANASFTVQPNPVRNTAVVQFSVEQAGRYSLKLIDVTGREYEIMPEQLLQSGEHIRQLHSAGLAHGTYYCVLSGTHGKRMIPLVLQR